MLFYKPNPSTYQLPLHPEILPTPAVEVLQPPSKDVIVQNLECSNYVIDEYSDGTYSLCGKWLNILCKFRNEMNTIYMYCCFPNFYNSSIMLDIILSHDAMMSDYHQPLQIHQRHL